MAKGDHIGDANKMVGFAPNDWHFKFGIFLIVAILDAAGLYYVKGDPRSVCDLLWDLCLVAMTFEGAHVVNRGARAISDRFTLQGKRKADK